MKKRIIIVCALLFLMLLGVSYAWFNYYEEGNNQELVAGDIYLTMDEGNGQISLNNILPETAMDARLRNDNYTIFTMSGKNSSNKTIYYEILLDYGETDSLKTRFRDQDITFDLIELDENDNEVKYLLDAKRFDTLDNKRIWVDTIDANGEEEVTKKYKLRAWLSEDVVISDTELNATYPATGNNAYSNHYATVKASVFGDFTEKNMYLLVKSNRSCVENGKSYLRADLSNGYISSNEGIMLNQADTMRLVITNPEDKISFTYIDSDGTENWTNQDSLDLTYNYNKNKTMKIQVFMESKNNSNVNTTVHFVVYKNGETVDEFDQVVNVVGDNYCLNNGFYNLAECVLVSENMSRSKSEAISYINSKGAPDINTTAPTYIFTEQEIENQSFTDTTGFQWYYGDKYSFDQETGMFTLKKEDGVTDSTTLVNLSTDLIGKYTTGAKPQYSYRYADTVYKIESVNVASGTITGKKITYKEISSLDSQVGLYKARDDYGDSYIYRGNVTNNNVKFGNYYWKILRINGDGSIRLIFNGNTLAADGNKNAGFVTAVSPSNSSGVNEKIIFNRISGSPAYAGYMYNTNPTPWESNQIVHDVYAAGAAYYWGESYNAFVDEYGLTRFELVPGPNNYPVVTKTISEMLNDTTGQLAKTPYLCKVTNSPSCSTVHHVMSIINETRANVKYITVSPNTTDLSIVYANNIDSNAKIKLELWYKNRFMNTLNRDTTVTDYISDGTFCSDRSIPNTYTNGSYSYVNPSTSGYSVTASTRFAASLRLYYAEAPYKSASLMCANAGDKFSTTSSYGNAKLTYPVGMITADEVALAGGSFNRVNEKYWLRTGAMYWTMTPMNYSFSGILVHDVYVDDTGSVSYVAPTSNTRGIRAVINLKENTKIISGDGTASDPYIIE